MYYNYIGVVVGAVDVVVEFTTIIHNYCNDRRAPHAVPAPPRPPTTNTR